MTICTTEDFRFGSVKGRVVEGGFNGGAVTSDGGILLLREADRLLGLTAEIAQEMEDGRQAGKCDHSIVSMLRQRVYGIALGSEDLNDQDFLRHDLAWQTAVGAEQPLASSPTLCRFENRASRRLAWKIHKTLLRTFIKHHKEVPEELVLDFDATDDPVHGNQEGRFFHGYYGHYCFLPLYVTCGDWVLVSYLRRSNIDPAKHSLAILSFLVQELRRAWPNVGITLRADSGFCRHWLFSWCERNDVNYIVGIAKNNRLLIHAEQLMNRAERRFVRTGGEKQRLFDEFRYAADTWHRKRRVIAKAEYNEHGPNPRFVVTNLRGDPKYLYDTLYCARGDMENRIKQQIEMFADRTSCHGWWANQFRLLLSTLAYTLVHVIRAVGLKGTAFARAQVGTIRLNFLKLGAVVVRNTRRVRFMFSSAYPRQELFALLLARLQSG